MEKLLIIGENPANDPDLLRVMEREGYQVLTALHGPEGLEMLRAERPAIVVVDHQLDDGDGVKILKQARKANPTCEAILVTSGGEMEAAIEVLRAGALDYLYLPIDVQQLRVALGRARERRRQKQAVEPAAILILEDHEPTLRRLVQILEKEGYQVYSAPDGQMGMSLFDEKRIDLVLADLKMPLKDGLSVLREIREKGADAEVIVVTGYGDENIVVQALRNGANNFLRKPIDIEQMLLAVQKALEYQTTRRSLAYRNRDVELMQELVVRLTNSLELVVETPERMSPKAIEFLHQLIDTLPLGVVVAGPGRKVLFANRHVVDKVGTMPEVLSPDWLETVGIYNVTEEKLDQAFSEMIKSTPGTIETLVLSKWAFLVMTPLKLVRPDLTERFVAIAIRGERGPRKTDPS